MGIGVFFGPGRAHAKHLLGVVFPDFIVGDHRHANALEYGLLIPGFAHAIAVNGAGLQRGRHLRRRGDREQHIGVDLAGDIRAGVIARMNAARRQPITQFIIVRRDRKYHAHIKGLALGLVLFDHGFQVIGLDRMYGFAVCVQRHIRLHLSPDGVGNGDAVAVQIHAERGNNVGPGAKTDGRPQRLAGQHMRAVQLAVDDAIEQHLPVGLRFQRDVQPFVLEITLLVGDRQWRHIGEFDKAEFKVFFFKLGRSRKRDRAQAQDQGGGY